MKKILLSGLALAMLIACNDGDKKPAGDNTGKPAVEDISANPDYKKGLDLIAASDCFTCHKIDDKVNGPAYREVAEKYAGADLEVQKSLASKIIDGGVGVWGQVPMTPHPSLSEEDALAMVKYILLLKK